MPRTTERFAKALVAALCVASCGTDAMVGPELLQGIDGLVLIGPQCPVQSIENPCPDLPHVASIEIRDSQDRFVVRVRSDAQGEFRTGLSAGDYILRPQSGDPFPVAGPLEVTVTVEQYVQVVVMFDTGIR